MSELTDENYRVLCSCIIAQAFRDLVKQYIDLYVVEHRTDTDRMAHMYQKLYAKVRSRTVHDFNYYKRYKVDEAIIEETARERMQHESVLIDRSIKELKEFFLSERFGLFADSANGEWFIQEAQRYALEYLKGKRERMPNCHFDGMFARDY